MPRPYAMPLTPEIKAEAEERFRREHGYDMRYAPKVFQEAAYGAARTRANMRRRSQINSLRVEGALACFQPQRCAPPAAPDFLEVTIPRLYLKDRADRGLGCGYGTYNRVGDYKVLMSSHEIDEMRADAQAVVNDNGVALSLRGAALKLLNRAFNSERQHARGRRL